MYSRFKKKTLEEIKAEAVKSSTEGEATVFVKNKVVTISREFGSGGRTVGKEVAKKLGIPCYDSELIEKIAKESGLSEQYVEKHGEYAQSDSLYANAVVGRVDGQSNDDKVWLAQQKVVCDLVKQGPCVIVGRCADYILRDVADCLTVFVHASDEQRAERIVEVYGQREESPAQRLHDKDNKRRAYYELYTGMAWGDASNYQLCLDSGKIGIANCVNIIANLYKKK